LYFEMSFRERKEKALPKNFDQYVYRDMHEWLKHKPTMTPPHFLNPIDGNYMLPTILEYGTGDFLNHSRLKERSLPTSPLQAYSSAAAYDAAAEVLEDSEDVPGETEVSVAGNQTVPAVRCPLSAVRCPQSPAHHILYCKLWWQAYRKSCSPTLD
jgi:hypothetical protein